MHPMATRCEWRSGRQPTGMSRQYCRGAFSNAAAATAAPLALQHKTKARHSGSGSPKLSAEILREHDAAGAAAAVPSGSAGRARRRPPRSPSTLSSESHDSIEDWCVSFSMHCACCSGIAAVASYCLLCWLRYGTDAP